MPSYLKARTWRSPLGGPNDRSPGCRVGLHAAGLALCCGRSGGSSRPEAGLDAAKIKTPHLDPQLEVLYAGDRLTVYGAGPRYLLATKLFAARAHDFDDAVRLAAETGITTSDEMLDLLSAAYPHRLLTPRIDYNAREVARAVQESPPLTRGQ